MEPHPNQIPRSAQPAPIAHLENDKTGNNMGGTHLKEAIDRVEAAKIPLPLQDDDEGEVLRRSRNVEEGQSSPLGPL